MFVKLVYEIGECEVRWCVCCKFFEVLFYVVCCDFLLMMVYVNLVCCFFCVGIFCFEVKCDIVCGWIEMIVCCNFNYLCFLDWDVFEDLMVYSVILM